MNATNANNTSDSDMEIFFIEKVVNKRLVGVGKVSKIMQFQWKVQNF